MLNSPNGGAIFRVRDFKRSSLVTFFIWIMITFTAPNTTAAFTCWNWGITLSQICSLSFSSFVLYLAKVVRMAIRPHSEHSFKATRSLVRVAGSMMKRDWLGRTLLGDSSSFGEPGWEEGRLREASWMSPSAATAFATTCQLIRHLRTLIIAWHTIGLPSPIRSLKVSMNPYSIASSGFKSNTLATHRAAVFRT